MNAKLNSEQQILTAARKVFIQRGFDGARMQEIADTAGINKGLLHYYYRSKGRLFDAVFEEALLKMIPRYNNIFETSDSLYKKIEDFIGQYMTVLAENPTLPAFVLNELNRNGEDLLTRFEAEGIDPTKFYKEVEQRVATGAIVAVDPRQLFMNILSMCMFPFVGGNMIKASMSVSDEEFDRLMVRRKKDISRFVINAIRR